MTRYWLAGVAAFAMMSGVAFAQSGMSESSTQSTTTTNAPMTGNFSASKTQKTINPDGSEVSKSKTYNSGAGGTSASSSTKVETPDGSQMNSYHEEQSNTPVGETSTSTTTINR